MKKILFFLPILLSSILLCSCVTGADKEDKDEVKKVKADCEYYKNTPNYINLDLKKEYDKEKSALYIRSENTYCDADCITFARNEKWNFVEIYLIASKDLNNFPRKTPEGYYKLSRSKIMFLELYNRSKKEKNPIFSICKENEKCVYCSRNDYCIKAEKISKPKSNNNIIIQKNKINENTILLNNIFMYKDNIVSNYKELIYSTNNTYTNYGFGMCKNFEGLNNIQDGLFGGRDE